MTRVPHRAWFLTLFFLAASSSPIAVLQRSGATAPEKGGEDETGPYDVVANWWKPVEPGWIVYAVDVFAESPNRIFVGSTGTSPVPEPGRGGRGAAPLQLFNLNIPGAKLDHFLTVADRDGRTIEEWKQWYGLFSVPHRITMNPYDPERHVWVIDRGSQQIFEFSNDGKQLVMTLGEKGVAGSDDKHFGRPTDIAFLPDGTFFISDGYDNARVVKFDKNGKYLTAWGTKGAAPGQFDLPHCIAVDSRRRLYVADRSNHRIQIFDENGKFLDEWRNIPQPHHLMITQDQFLWVADGTTSRIAKYDLNGKLLTYWGTQGINPGYMNQPHAFGVDSEGTLYIANGLNHRVEKFTPKANADRSRLVGQSFGPASSTRSQ